ncbi:hypothetical protein [Caldimonas tepidiphila]|uniref:hypothetical protein n=1 Tax=Caldimonas tepidiphila TaxID=2315841 RepID=UPI000E5B3BC4|nr:hypothetical protein [Caldimonas tepidiphila]
MTGIDKALLRHLLAVEGPWEVSDYQLDLRKRRCEVWIGPQVERGWFGRPKALAAALQTHTWQHLSFGGLRFVVHASLPAGLAEAQRQPWMGEPGLPFTTALARQVFAFFNEGVPLRSVCTLLGLSLNDVWHYRHALDTGRAHVQSAPAPAESAAPASAALPPEVAQDAGSGRVPEPGDPIWLRLASGELQLDIRVLSLKLMLARVRSQLDVISDEEVRQLKLRELHRYFVKNERVLSHELSQLRMG